MAVTATICRPPVSLCKWRWDTACTGSQVRAFVEVKFQGFLLYPEEAGQWEIKIGHSYEYFLLVKCWYLQHFCSVVTELKGLLLAQAQGRIGFFINPGVQPNVFSEKGSPDTAWGTKVQPPGLHLLW